MSKEEQIKRALEQREAEEGHTFDESNKSLGKVITPEQKDMNARVEHLEARIKSETSTTISNDLTISIGYTPLDLSKMPSQGKFYPNGTSIQIRSAKAMEIEHWSTMNESDPIDVEMHFNDILKSCMKFKISHRELPFGNLLEADKLFVLLKIQELTFVEDKNPITLSVNCTKCNAVNKKKLDAEALEVSTEQDDQLEKYYNREKSRYTLKTKSFGEIDLFVPTVGIMEYTYNYVRNKTRLGQYYNKSLMQLLPFIVEDYSDLTDADIEAADLNFKTWDTRKFSLVYNFANKIKVGIKPTVKFKCKSCESLEETRVNFPSGPKALFIISDFDDELL